MNNSCETIDVLGSILPGRFQDYRIFAFGVNGVLSTGTICFGLVGNVLLAKQVVQRSTIRHRLGQHLVALSFWDSLLLLTRLLSSASVALIYGTLRLYGWPALLAYGINPVSNFAVSGNIWQVVCICAERYIHVLLPLLSRVYVQYVSVKTISISIIIIGLLSNFSQYFEYGFMTCLDGEEEMVQIVAAEFTIKTKHYTLAVHLIPDLFLRCPLPFLLVSYFTLNTIFSMRKQRRLRAELLAAHVRNEQSQSKTAEIALTLLGAKFLLCNSLFMAHTVLDLLNLSPDNYWSYYLTLLYLADVSNFLLLVNAATDWLLFYGWKPNHGQNINCSSPAGRSRLGTLTSTNRRHEETRVLVTSC